MALAQLLNRSCNSPDAVFRTIRDFLISANGIDDFTPSGNNPGPGYELVDASYASGDPDNTTTNDWCVLRSHGEAGTYPHYLRLVFGSTLHQIWLYLHWDAATHTGFAPVGTTNGNVYHNGAGQVAIWLHADLDEIHPVIRPQGQSYYYWTAFGRLKPDHLAYSGQAVQVAAAVEAGDDVVITLPSWPDWARVGRKVYNWDTASLHELEIAAASEAARTITVARSWAKNAGSWLTEDLLLFCHRSYNYGVRSNDIFAGLPPRSGAPATQQWYWCGVLQSFWALDNKYGRHVTMTMPVMRANEYRGSLALIRDAYRWGAANPGEAWTDEAGLPWRVYPAYSGSDIILREAL